MRNIVDLDITVAHRMDRGLLQLQYSEEIRRIMQGAAKRTRVYLGCPTTMELLKAKPKQALHWAAAQKALEGLGSKENEVYDRFLTPRMAYSCLLLFANANAELNRNGKKWKHSVSVIVLLSQIAPREVSPMPLPLLQNPWTGELSVTVYEGFSLALRNGPTWFSLHELVLAWMTLCEYPGKELGIKTLRRKLAGLTREFREATQGL